MIENYREHAANERTFLAWVRTVIAIVGFGLAASRLGGDAVESRSEIGLLIAGAVVLGLAFLRMRHLRRRIESRKRAVDDALPADALLLLLVTSLFVLLGAFALHVW